MNIKIDPANHNTQISQSFTPAQLAQLVTLHFTPIEQCNTDLLTIVFKNSVEVLFSKGQIPPLVSLCTRATDADAISAAEQTYTTELAVQNSKQICKQLAFNVVVFNPEKQVAIRQLLLTSSLSIYSVLDIHRDRISQSLKNEQCQSYITNWAASIVNVLFANKVPSTLTAALAAIQGFELAIDYMGTMALIGQNPLGEYD